MQTDTDTLPRQPAARWKTALGGMALVALGALVSYTVVRENRGVPQAQPALAPPAAAVQAPAAPEQAAQPVRGLHPEPAAAAERPALAAADERYASALWQVHTTVKTSALKMTFAGLAYKMGDTDRAGVRTRVEPLIRVFAGARAQARAIVPPAGQQGRHAQYLEAITLYERAAREMIRVAGDGSDAHLIAAQQMSEKASNVLLEVGDVFWPGEYKPN